ncbi:MAG: hypothetical protein Tsb005_01020 [Gammaproteobacteria bacterium]
MRQYITVILSSTKTSLIQAWSLYKKSLKQVWWLSLLMVVMIEQVNVLYKIVLLPYVADLTKPLLVIAWLLLPLLLTTMIGVFLYSLMFQRASLVAYDQRMAWGRSVKLIRRRFSALVFAQILYALFTFGTAYFFIPLGVFLGILFILSIPLMIIDDNSPMESFQRSYELVWGRWWQTFAVILVPMLLHIVISLSTYAGSVHASKIFGPEMELLGKSIITLFYISSETLLLPFVVMVVLVQFRLLKSGAKKTAYRAI